MDSLHSIIGFKIVYFNQNIIKTHPISDFFKVESLITTYGITNIRMICFYFSDIYQFPYQIHPIILQPRGNRLYVIFYHYYNALNQLTIMCLEQQIHDYNRLLQFLDHSGSVLLPLIESPFIT